MRKFLAAAVVAALSSCVPAPAYADDLPSGYAAQTGGYANEMKAHWQFCVRYSAECRPTSPTTVKLTPQRWAQLKQVNDEINTVIAPVSDQDHWKETDRWDLAEDGRGDCDEYVLIKRQKLASLGFQRGSLLYTVVLDEEGSGHAVLTVVTDRGDFILDNRRREIVDFVEARYLKYEFIKRQNRHDPMKWDTIIGPKPNPEAQAAVRTNKS